MRQGRSARSVTVGENAFPDRCNVVAGLGRDYLIRLLLAGWNGTSFLVSLGFLQAFLLSFANVISAGRSLIAVLGSRGGSGRSIAVSRPRRRAWRLTLSTGTQSRQQRETKQKDHPLHISSPFHGREKLIANLNVRTISSALTGN